MDLEDILLIGGIGLAAWMIYNFANPTPAATTPAATVVTPATTTTATSGVVSTPVVTTTTAPVVVATPVVTTPVISNAVTPNILSSLNYGWPGETWSTVQLQNIASSLAGNGINPVTATYLQIVNTASGRSPNDNG